MTAEMKSVIEEHMQSAYIGSLSLKYARATAEFIELKVRKTNYLSKLVLQARVAKDEEMALYYLDVMQSTTSMSCSFEMALIRQEMESYMQ